MITGLGPRIRTLVHVEDMVGPIESGDGGMSELP
jgi:hypothetical protein